MGVGVFLYVSFVVYNMGMSVSFPWNSTCLVQQTARVNFHFSYKKKIPLYHCFLGICVSSVHLSWMYYNAILTLSTQSYCQIPNLRSKSFISCLISLTSATGQSSPSHPHFQNTGYRFKGYCDPLRCDMVHLKWVTDLRNVLYLLLHFHYEKYT